MEPVMSGAPWSGNAKHFMIFVEAFCFTGQAEIKIWADNTFEPDPKDGLVAAITNNTSVGWTWLV